MTLDAPERIIPRAAFPSSAFVWVWVIKWGELVLLSITHTHKCIIAQNKRPLICALSRPLVQPRGSLKRSAVLPFDLQLQSPPAFLLPSLLLSHNEYRRDSHFNRLILLPVYLTCKNSKEFPAFCRAAEGPVPGLSPQREDDIV